MIFVTPCSFLCSPHDFCGTRAASVSFCLTAQNVPAFCECLASPMTCSENVLHQEGSDWTLQPVALGLVVFWMKSF